MKKVLITGGAGFIGSNLCSYLLKKKYQIVVYDNLSTGKLKNLPRNIKFVKGDIRNKKLLIKNFTNFKYVIHLAAKSALQETIDNPLECININIFGTQNILDLCLKYNSKLIFASTCAVYPLNLKKKAKEEEDGSFITPYSISKISSEKLIEFYVKKKGLKAVILRFFNVYGKNQNPNSQYSGVIAKFIKKAKKNLDLELYNGGIQKRDFIHVNDICDAINKSLKFKEFEIFNVGTGKTIRINDLAKIIVNYLKKGKIKNGKKVKFDAFFSCADISKIKKKIKFIPKIDLKNGIKILINEKKKI